jgi:hypothetical protein
MTSSVHDVGLAVSAFHAGSVDYLVEPLSAARIADAFARAGAARAGRTGTAELQRELDARSAQITEVLAELELTTAISLDALVAARHPTDPGAPGRAHRVARLAVNLALALQVPEPQVSDIERAVFLRDPGPPSEAWQRTLAALRTLPSFARAVDIARAAHERYDGSGMPQGLRGNQIPLGARIVALAVACDDLVSSGIQTLQAIDILRTRRAAEFDAAAVEALAALQPSWGTSAQPLTEDPRRRWRRKHVAPGVLVQVGGHPARLVEVSYGGFRIETVGALDATPASRFIVQLLGQGVTAEAKWVMPLSSGGRYWCGAAVSAEESHAGSRWRAVVDALQESADQTLM